MKQQDTTLWKAGGVALFLLAIGIFVTVSVQKNPTPAFVAHGADENAPSPTASVRSNEPQITDVHASDGTHNLRMRSVKTPDGATEYTFVASDIAGNNGRVILTKTAPAGGSMSIPYNSWSPDNKQVLVQEHGAGGTVYYVLRADGSAFTTGDTILDIGARWREKEIAYVLRDVPGWAADNLVIVYTSKDDGTRGPAYWFLTDTGGFMQLAH